MPAKLDQHFLIDGAAADKIVAAAELRGGERVVEIGPGRGVLTERLLGVGARVTAVEFDPELADRLRRKYIDGNLDVIHSDWLRLDLSSLPAPAKIVSNLPYSVATPILQRLLDWPAWTIAVLMFQKEVADRILAPEGTKPYGILSLSVRIKADAERLCDVGRESFRPPPKVESSVVVLRRLSRTRLPNEVAERDFFRVVKAAFGQRRKMAAKNLAAEFGAERAAVEKHFRACSLRKDARAETVPLKAFIELTQRLCESGA
ncbi:MAG: 16S rRNA (adenine(1518)-N(6)/adenine(1519)-N(6))-dimethyltransferase RsmA [Elusimicrobiota bacterium]